MGTTDAWTLAPSARMMQEMALTRNEVLERLCNAGDTFKLGKQRIPRSSDSKLDVSCGCSLIRPGVFKCIRRGAGHEMGEALPDVAVWYKHCVNGLNDGIASCKARID
eukprot:3480035-Pleurochrysis_carterae.AAC.1